MGLVRIWNRGWVDFREGRGGNLGVEWVLFWIWEKWGLWLGFMNLVILFISYCCKMIIFLLFISDFLWLVIFEYIYFINEGGVLFKIMFFGFPYRKLNGVDNFFNKIFYHN